jgi:hypothetical protein
MHRARVPYQLKNLEYQPSYHANYICGSNFFALALTIENFMNKHEYKKALDQLDICIKKRRDEALKRNNPDPVHNDIIRLLEKFKRDTLSVINRYEYEKVPPIIINYEECTHHSNNITQRRFVYRYYAGKGQTYDLKANYDTGCFERSESLLQSFIRKSFIRRTPESEKKRPEPKTIITVHEPHTSVDDGRIKKRRYEEMNKTEQMHERYMPDDGRRKKRRYEMNIPEPIIHERYMPEPEKKSSKSSRNKGGKFK